MFSPPPMHHQLGCPQFDMGNIGINLVCLSFTTRTQSHVRKGSREVSS